MKNICNSNFKKSAKNLLEKLVFVPIGAICGRLSQIAVSRGIV
jgi:hypothetical protein